MELLLKLLLVVSGFLLHHILLWNVTLHGGSFRLFPVLAALWMVPVFIGAWGILLWKRGVLLVDILLLLLGVIVWGIVVDAGSMVIHDIPLAIYILLGEALFGYVFVRLLGQDLIQRLMLRVFPVMVYIGLLVALLTVTVKEMPETILFLPVILVVSLFVGIFLPSMVVLFPLYVWVFGKTRLRFLSLAGSVLVVFPLTVFLASNYGKDLIYSMQDPCYEVVDGKAPSYIIRKDRVCVMDGNRGMSAATTIFKTLEGADPASFEETGSGYAKDKNHIYHGDKIDDSFDGKAFRR